MFTRLIAAGADAKARNSSSHGIVEKVIDDENIDMLKFLLENGHIDDPNFPKDVDMSQFDFHFHQQAMTRIEEETDDEDDMEEEAKG